MRWRVGLWVAVATVVIGSASAARATPAPGSYCPTFGVRFPQQVDGGAEPVVEIPSDGGLLLWQTEREVRLSIEVRDSSGVLVDGSSAPFGTHFVWSAASPLDPAMRYDVLVETTYDGGYRHPDVECPVLSSEVALEPTARWTPTLDGVQAEGVLEVDSDAHHNINCCVAPDGSEECFTTKHTERPAVRLTFQWGDVPSGQFFVRAIRAVEHGAIRAWRHSSQPLTVVFDAPQETYCVEAEARHLMDETITERWAFCIPDTGLDVPDPRSSIAEGLRAEHCAVPPDNRIEQWCDVNAGTCTTDRSARGCDEFPRLCVGDAGVTTGGATGGGCRLVASGRSDAPSCWAMVSIVALAARRRRA